MKGELEDLRASLEALTRYAEEVLTGIIELFSELVRQPAEERAAIWEELRRLQAKFKVPVVEWCESHLIVSLRYEGADIENPPRYLECHILEPHRCPAPPLEPACVLGYQLFEAYLMETVKEAKDKGKMENFLKHKDTTYYVGVVETWPAAPNRFLSPNWAAIFDHKQGDRLRNVWRRFYRVTWEPGYTERLLDGTRRRVPLRAVDFTAIEPPWDVAQAFAERRPEAPPLDKECD